MILGLPLLTWFLVEALIVFAALAAWWGWNTVRLRRRQAALRADLIEHLNQVNSALGRVAEASQTLYGEVERLFSEPAAGPNVERLRGLRESVRKQRENLLITLNDPVAPRAMLREAMPTIRHAVEQIEEHLSNVLRQWDDAMSGAPLPPPPAEAAGESEEATTLAALRSEHEALRKMHEDLVTAHREANARIEELEALAAAAPEAGAEVESEGEDEPGQDESAEVSAPEEGPKDLRDALEELDAAQKIIGKLEERLREAKANEGAYDRLQERVDALQKQNIELQRRNELFIQEQLREAEEAQGAATASDGAAVSPGAATPVGGEGQAAPAGSTEREQELEARIKELREEVVNLRAAAVESGSKSEGESDRIAELEAELAIAKAAADDMAASRKKMREQLQEAQTVRTNERNDLMAENRQLKATVENLKKQAEEATRQCEQVRQELDQFQPFMQTLEEHNQAQEQEIKRQREEIKTLRAQLAGDGVSLHDAETPPPENSDG